MHPSVAALRGGLIVSCQADPGDPLFGPQHMAAMARAAAAGGAVGIRTGGPAEIRAIRAAVALPIIGLYKTHHRPVYITPTMGEVRAVAEAGADIVALQLTAQPRPDGLSRAEAVAAIRREFPGLAIMADVATREEGLEAAALGVDLIGTTMSGYTPDSPRLDGPDLDLVRALSQATATPVIAEGRISTPRECRMALEAGAYAVVVGTAITRPQVVTGWFVNAMQAKETP